MTIGTPHRGAPLFSNFGNYGNYTATAFNAMLNAGNAVGYLAGTRGWPEPGYCCDWQWIASQVFQSLNVGVNFLNFGFNGAIASLGLHAYVPVFGEMHPYSGFIQDLNWPSNVSAEAGAVPARVSIVSSTPIWGGIFRTISPGIADEAGYAVHGAAWTFYYFASDILARADIGDWEAQDAAYRLLSAANYLDSFDVVWCATVSSVDMSYCEANDSVVPVSSQVYPSGAIIYTGDESGPAHTEEKQQGHPWLHDALANYVHVGPPGSGGGGGGGGGGGAATLSAGQTLYPGQAITSPNGRFVLTYQTDGNLVVYDYGAAVWAINWWPHCVNLGAPGRATMQTDGNFVVYDANGSPVFHTWTFGNPGAHLALQNDGNLVVYNSGGGVLWQR